MNQNESNNQNVSQEFYFLYFVTAIADERKTISKIAGAVTAVALVACLLWPNTFTARTLLLPPQSGQNSSSSVLATLGVLSSVGGAAVGGLKSPEELYVSLLKSRTIA